MAEGTYEYEVERAELLGVTPPDRASWEAAQAERRQQEQVDYEIAQDAEIASQQEQLQNTGGKVDELNSILNITQKKINKFKTVCGSLTSLIKIRPGSAGGSTADLNGDGEPEKNDINTAIEALEDMQQAEADSTVTAAKKSMHEVGRKLSSHFDALDSLLMKTERAEASMRHQNQQMKKHLDK